MFPSHGPLTGAELLGLTRRWPGMSFFAAPIMVSMEGFNTNPQGVADPWLPFNAAETVGNNVDAYIDVNADKVAAINEGRSPSSDAIAWRSARGLDSSSLRWRTGMAAEPYFTSSRTASSTSSISRASASERWTTGMPSSAARARNAALGELLHRADDERWHLRRNGERFFASGVTTPLREVGRLFGANASNLIRFDKQNENAGLVVGRWSELAGVISAVGTRMAVTISSARNAVLRLPRMNAPSGSTRLPPSDASSTSASSTSSASATT